MTTSLEREHDEIVESFHDVEELEDIARRVPEEEALRLHEVVRSLLERVHPVRPRIAGHMLALSDRTVRAWTEEGVLTRADSQSTRLLLDPKRLHLVVHVVRDLRAAGRNRELLDAVWMRLQDQALLDREDLRESLDQMRHGAANRA